MVRAYKKPGSLGATKFYCEHCESYYDYSAMTNRTLYTLQGSSYDIGDEYAYEDYVSWDVYWCDYCENVITVDESPNKVHVDTYVCGACKEEHEDQQEAQECCDDE
jgi:hypothetical protein